MNDEVAVVQKESEREKGGRERERDRGEISGERKDLLLHLLPLIDRYG